jgi:hypothetical protein
VFAKLLASSGFVFTLDDFQSFTIPNRFLIEIPSLAGVSLPPFSRRFLFYVPPYARFHISAPAVTITITVTITPDPRSPSSPNQNWNQNEMDPSIPPLT